jgi:ubiquinone/menaquinone biosynthesis C-methylase UbiE
LKEHPYLLVRKLIEEQLEAFKTFQDILFIEDQNKSISSIKEDMEKKHHHIWDALWNKYDPAAFEEKVDRYKRRIKINNLEPLIKGKTCLDLGSGHGTFTFALAELGASFATGIDFSEESVAFANKVRALRKSKDKTKFEVGSVYTLPYPDDSCEFILQNGVFHHLHDEVKAIVEASRVLKKGGYFWYYTDGEGGISYDLWDKSVYLLRNVPIEFIQMITKDMHVSTNKSYHLGDGLKATYRHTSWEKITAQLAAQGFGNFKRLQGGFDTDLDGPTMQNDPYAKEKFGEGDLRILAQLVEKKPEKATKK